MVRSLVSPVVGRGVLLLLLLMASEVSAEPAKTSSAPLKANTLGLPLAAQIALAQGTLRITGTSAVGTEKTAPPKMGHAVVLGGASYEATVLAKGQKGCGDTVAALRKLAPQAKLASAGFAIEVGLGLITSSKAKLYDVSPTVCQLEYHTDRVLVDTQLLSFVGPFVTVSSRVSEALAGGPPYHGEYWSTWDVRTKASAKVTDAVVEADLVKALLKDPYVIQYHKAQLQKLGSAPDYEAVRATLFGLSPTDPPLAFSFFEYNAAKNKVALRLAIPVVPVGLGINDQTTLGLWVRPTAKNQQIFARAAKGEGVLMGGARPRIRI